MPAKKYTDFDESLPFERIAKHGARDAKDTRQYVSVRCPHCASTPLYPLGRAPLPKSPEGARVTFQQRPSTYRISIAPSSRAHCRACKRRVEKGVLRITITAFVRPGRSTQLVRCIDCMDARFGAAMLAVYGTPARVPAEASVSVADATAVRTRLQHIACERVEET